MVQLYKEREGVTQLQEVLSSYSLTDGASEPTLIVDAIQFKKKEKKRNSTEINEKRVRGGCHDNVVRCVCQCVVVEYRVASIY